MDMNNLAMALGGMSAGLQGNLPQFQQVQNQRMELDQRQQMMAQEQEQQKLAQQQAMEQERIKTMYQDAAAAYQYGSRGNWAQVILLGNERLNLLKRMPGVDYSDTERMLQLAIAAHKGGPEGEEAARLALGELETAVAIGQDVGFLSRPESVKASELAQVYNPETGQMEYSSAGNAIGRPSANPNAVKPEALSQFGGQSQFVDEEDNLFFGTTRRNPSTGAVESVLAPIGGNPSAQPVGRVQMVNDLGQTARQRTNEAGLQAGTTAAAQAAMRASEAAFGQLGPIRQSLATFDDVLDVLDSGGVDTGPIMSKLPSFRENAIKLDQLQGQMGLDVVAGGNFGALSEAELQFALDTALPKNLEPAALREWVVKKRAAQEKLSQELERAAIYLGTPGNTIAGFVERSRNARTAPAESGGGSAASAVHPATDSSPAIQRLRYNPETGRLE